MIIKPDTIVFDKDKAEYKVTDSIGNGGFATVFKLERMTDKSCWALKALSESYRDEKILKGMVNEGNLALDIAHPNVIKYLFFHDGSLFNELPPYIIMEFANQGTLRKLLNALLDKKEFVPNNELHKYFDDLINGMEAINAKLVHRDIKPENILIKDNVLRISDFGLSKIVEEQTRTSTFKGFGTAKYTAPECWRNEKNTIKIDIYSMGIVFYELATFQHPLKVSDSVDWRDAHLFQIPQNPRQINQNLSPVISQVILKMLEKDVSRRFNSWGEIRDVLKKGTLAQTSNSVLIDSMLKNRMKKDEEVKAEQAIQQKKQTERDEFLQLIKFKIERDIITPLKSLIDEFNEQYTGNKITLSSKGDYEYLIRLASGYVLSLEIKPLFDEDFMRIVEFNDYGERRRIQRLQRPLCRGKKIFAWGCLHNQYGKGFNLLLVDKDDDAYGEWLVMWNTNSGLNSNPSPQEPFAFRFGELEREVQAIGAMHQYDIKVEPLKIEHFVRFIDESI